MRASSLSIVLLLGSACVFEDDTPARAQITCLGSNECPPTLQCAPMLKQCVPITDDVDGPDLDSSSLSTTRMGPDGVLDIALVADETLHAESRVQVGETLLEPVIEDGTHLTASVEAAALGTGVFPVVAVLLDPVGNPAAHVLGAVEVDASAPEIVDGSIVVDITPPPGVVPTADPALALGGRISVAFRTDELTADVRVVALRGPADAPDDVLTLDLLLHDAVDWSFTATLDTPVDEGDYTLVAELVDTVGNAGTHALAAVRVAGAVGAECVARTGAGDVVCTDADGDGALGPGPGCADGEATDCDDTRFNVGPQAVEVPDNGLDDDCDGDDLSMDDPDLLARSVFFAPGAPLDGAGTRAQPTGDLHAAWAQLAALDPSGRGYLFSAAGTVQLGDDIPRLHGSWIGGYDTTFTERTGRTRMVTMSGVTLEVTASNAPQLIAGVELLGPTCNGITSWEESAHPVRLDDVLVKNVPSAVCAALYGVYLARPLHARSLVVDLECDEFDATVGLAVSGEQRITDSEIRAHCALGSVDGIAETAGGAILRSRISVSGDEARGVWAEHVDMYNNVITADSTRNTSGYGGGVSTELGTIAHNTFNITGPAVVAVRTLDGAVIANDLIALGDGAAGVVRYDLPGAGPSLWGNRFDVDASGCLVRLGGQAACSTLVPCPLCGASDDNTLAPDAPPPQSALDRGAASSVALDLDGVCRGETSPVGPRVTPE